MIEKIPTIFDTDPGIDDAFALSFLNKSEIFDDNGKIYTPHTKYLKRDFK